jgi:hypothetical protein
VPVITPLSKLNVSRINARLTPSAKLNNKILGLSNIELTINAASKCCETPFLPSAAIIGTVPYIHKGDTTPRKEARQTGNNQNFPVVRFAILSVILLERKTDTNDPVISPKAQ